MDTTLPLHICKPKTLSIVINRSHTFIHSIALAAMIYYRASSFHYSYSGITIPWLMVFASELLLSFLWLLRQAYRWRPVSRTVFPERLPGDEQLPAIDVFICTADPKREPIVGVMNTVISSMALDYPPEKLSVYLSDDAASSVTLYAVREAWGFASSWLPFCTLYRIKCKCPEAYFKDEDQGDINSIEFAEQREIIKRKYELFKEKVMRAGQDGGVKDTRTMMGKNHPPIIEVMNDNIDSVADTFQAMMPRLVYVSREKRPSHPHNFKSGALNVLLRVSSIISNSPYILVLDCDMYCNDPSSARQAMCFHLDLKISPSLAFVQFPQKFHDIHENDIYDGQLRSTFMIKWPAMDGLRGPILSGTGFYMKRRALYGSPTQNDEFINSIRNDYKQNVINKDGLQKEAQFLASCSYEKSTQWGEQIGFLYHSISEDFFTGFILHSRGWTSVYCDPFKPAFLGSATTNLNDKLLQTKRWSSGFLAVGLSRFCPLVYGPLRMSVLQSMCYAFLAFRAFYSFPLWCLATIPQLCLLNGVPLYPKVSNPWFMLFSFSFISQLSKHLEEVIITGGTISIWWNEQRDRMIKSTGFLFGSLDAILKLIGLREAIFVPTNKTPDDEQVKRYEMSKFDFQTSTMLLAPMVTLVILNVVSFVGGMTRVIVAHGRGMNEMFGQIFLSFFILLVNYPIIDGMMFRKDKGSISSSTTLFSLVLAIIFLSAGTTVLMS